MQRNGLLGGVTTLLALASMSVASFGAQPSTPTAPPPADVQDITGPSITVTLTSGEVMRGTLKGVTQTQIIIQHPVLGELRIPRTGIASTQPPVPQILSPPAQTTPPTIKPPEPPKPSGTDGKADAVKPKAATDPIEAIFREDDASFLDGWKRQIEIGMNGTTGPRDGQNARVIANLHRSTTKMTTHVTMSYAYGQSNSQTTQDRAEATVRNDWNLDKTSWTLWCSGSGELDSQRRDSDGRVGASMGFGYVFEKSPKLSLVGRVGVGGSRELNGENAVTPELGIVGLSADYKFNEQTSTYANVEYFPNQRDTDDFRTILRAGVQTLLDKATNMNLRLGIEHRYDNALASDQAGKLDYFMVLGFAF
jgi:hypothetical protein